VHELALADSIARTVLQEIDRQKLPPVQKIVVRIGELHAVVPEALEFSFQAITADTCLSQAKLEIEPIPVEGHCCECQDDFAVRNFLFACPRCGSGKVKVRRGEEFEIAYLEVADTLQTGAGPAIV
jgi:hydrogenase nickel incorporation protein HypA/HybF